MFAALPDNLGFGTHFEPQQQPLQLAVLPGGGGFIKQGVHYRWVCCTELRRNRVLV
jgi:hypothetical protein